MSGTLFYRKVVRDAIHGLLIENFNSIMAATAQAYGLVPVRLDFSDSSDNFAVAHIQPEDIETCQLQEFPAACLYTTEAVDRGDLRLYRFAGTLMAHLDFYVRDREGAESGNTEDVFDAIEDTVMQVMNNPANNWSCNRLNVSVIYSRKVELGRQALIELSDGYATRIPITMLFEVRVP